MIVQLTADDFGKFIVVCALAGACGWALCLPLLSFVLWLIFDMPRKIERKFFPTRHFQRMERLLNRRAKFQARHRNV